MGKNNRGRCDINHEVTTTHTNAPGTNSTTPGTGKVIRIDYQVIVRSSRQNFELFVWVVCCILSRDGEGLTYCGYGNEER
jgi:hypothetical protein